MGDLQACHSVNCDHGIAAQSILLGAVEKGLGGCMIGTFKKNELRADLALAEQFDILLVLALGQPIESVTLENLPAGDSVRYWRDADSEALVKELTPEAFRSQVEDEWSHLRDGAATLPTTTRACPGSVPRPTYPISRARFTPKRSSRTG